MDTKITAIVPVRQGSRRLKNKNISSFAGSNLLLFKIEQLKKVTSINNIVVSSDSDHMLKIAKDAGVNTHKRSVEYCDEKTKSFGDVVAHIAASVEGDNILWATCTSPLVFPNLYQKSIKIFKQKVLKEKKYDSLVSVEPFQRYLWNNEGPVNYELGTKHLPSQELPVYYFITDGILLAPRQDMIKWKYFHGTNPYKMEIDKKSSVDIDDVLDLEQAKAWLKLEL